MCVCNGINIKTPEFEEYWNEVARKAGKDDLYCLFEEIYFKDEAYIARLPAKRSKEGKWYLEPTANNYHIWNHLGRFYRRFKG